MSLKNLFNSKDKKPVLLSFILQRDDCSRMFGEFAERHMKKCSKAIIIWKNGSENDIRVITSASLGNDEAALMLLKSSMVVGGSRG